MDHIATFGRASEEVSAPATTPTRSSRFTGIAVLTAIAAAVLGVSALGSAATGPTTVTDLAGRSAVQAAAPADPAGSAPAGTPAGGHNAGAHQPGANQPGANQPGVPGPAGADGSQAAPVEHTVGMAGLMFAPAALSIAAGDTVTWINDDTASHTVTVTDGPETFESELLAPGDTFTYTFTMPGEYEYYCAVHPDMKASVLVIGAPVPGEVPPVPGAGQPPVSDEVGCVPSTAFDSFMRHVEVAHLQSSPSQQTADLLALDQYIKTHTVLVQDMLQPTLDGVVTDATAKSLDAFFTHMEVAHLQSSPSQQIADLLAADQYVKTHTVLVQDMLKPHFEYMAC
jgi:plastocyanin